MLRSSTRFTCRAGNPPLGESDHDETALRRETPNALVEALAANGVEDRVDPEAVVLSTQRRDPVALGVEDMVRARSFGDVHLVGARGDGDHLGAEPASDLDRGRADPSRGAVDRDPIAGQDPSSACQGEMRGVVVHDESGRRLDASVRSGLRG